MGEHMNPLYRQAYIRQISKRAREAGSTRLLPHVLTAIRKTAKPLSTKLRK